MVSLEERVQGQTNEPQGQAKAGAACLLRWHQRQAMKYQHRYTPQYTRRSLCLLPVILLLLSSTFARAFYVSEFQ